MLRPPEMSLVALAPRSVGVASAADWRALTFLAMSWDSIIDIAGTLDRVQMGCYPWPLIAGRSGYSAVNSDSSAQHCRAAALVSCGHVFVRPVGLQHHAQCRRTGQCQF